MYFIAHRGNINGKILQRENTISYIEEALKKNFDCEIDVWLINDKVFLGHDKPEHLIDEDFLFTNSNKLWIHCKNIQALCKYKDDLNCFYHDKDLYTITSQGYIWGNINVETNKNIISVMPEINNIYSFNCKGICSDNIQYYKDLYNTINFEQ
jgi:hypothetical protein